MSIIKICKKIIPSKLKTKLKSEICGSTKYVVHYDEKKKLDGKLALVTGGSGAIGSAICFKLAMEGAVVVVCGRNLDKINYVVDNIKNSGGSVVPLILDVTDSNSIKDGINYIIKKYGNMDILVNNAGGSARDGARLFSEQNPDTIKRVLDTNLLGTMLCTYHALPYINSVTGRIINMSSVVGLQGKRGMSDYAAAKSGIIGFSRSLAIELGQKRITVNCISPGWINHIVFDYGAQHEEGNVNCFGISGKTDDVASLVAFLASNEAGFITGQNIAVDGGRSLGLWGDK